MALDADAVDLHILVAHLGKEAVEVVAVDVEVVIKQLHVRVCLARHAADQLHHVHWADLVDPGVMGLSKRWLTVVSLLGSQNPPDARTSTNVADTLDLKRADVVRVRQPGRHNLVPDQRDGPCSLSPWSFVHFTWFAISGSLYRYCCG